MNSTDPRHPWTRLVSAARLAPDERETAPYGFATRIAALALAQERRVTSVFDRFALRALGIACLLAVASIAINYSHMKSSPPAEEHIAGVAGDPMSVLLDA